MQVPFALNDLTVDEVEKLLTGYLTGGGDSSPPDLNAVLKTICNHIPVNVNGDRFSGPLMLLFKGDSTPIHGTVKKQQGGGKFEIVPSDPSSSAKLGTFDASAVLLARWYFLKVESISSPELPNIKTLLRELQVDGKIDLEEHANSEGKQPPPPDFKQGEGQKEGESAEGEKAEVDGQNEKPRELDFEMLLSS